MKLNLYTKEKILKVAFIGHFSPRSNSLGKASSVGGNQVQQQIISELQSNLGSNNLFSYSMRPKQSWPQDAFFVRRHNEENVLYFGYLNLPVIKHLVFSINMFIQLLVIRPKVCVQYNSYLIENLFLLIYRLFSPSSHLVIFIQDINIHPRASLFSKSWFRTKFESISLWFAKFFNTIIPISNAIPKDFCMDLNKCFLFQGGVTEFSLNLMRDSSSRNLEDIGVYAGALEAYNGIDKLIDLWIEKKIQWPLHVFGRGSLSSYVQLAADNSDKIIFHGFQPEVIVSDWITRARWNFCLRYSIGLNQEYFFPSKFFSLAVSNGILLVNNFYGLPKDLLNQLTIVSDDLSDLPEQLVSSLNEFDSEKIRYRQKIIVDNFSWKSCMESQVKRWKSVLRIELE